LEYLFHIFNNKTNTFIGIVNTNTVPKPKDYINYCDTVYRIAEVSIGKHLLDQIRVIPRNKYDRRSVDIAIIDETNGVIWSNRVRS
jgi:hypothetical protein